MVSVQLCRQWCRCRCSSQRWNHDRPNCHKECFDDCFVTSNVDLNRRRTELKLRPGCRPSSRLVSQDGGCNTRPTTDQPTGGRTIGSGSSCSSSYLSVSPSSPSSSSSYAAVIAVVKTLQEVPSTQASPAILCPHSQLHPLRKARWPATMPAEQVFQESEKRIE